MKIKKVNLKDGGCVVCNREKYDYSDNDVEVSYPYNFVYKLEIDHTIHRLCKDCLYQLKKEIDAALE